MTWRDNDLARETLEVQGYLDPDTGNLLQDVLAKSITDVFAKKPIRSSSDDLLDKKTRFIQAGVSRVQLLDVIFPGLRERHALSDEEQTLLKKDPKSHADLEERQGAINDLGTLIWGTLGKTQRSGAVQVRLVQMGLLLIDAKLPRDGQEALKIATDDQDLIIEYYVQPRGDQMVKVSGGVRDDCQMVALTFEGINERMKAVLGTSVTTAVRQLLQVATPDLEALSAGPSSTPKVVTSRSRA